MPKEDERKNEMKVTFEIKGWKIIYDWVIGSSRQGAEAPLDVDAFLCLVKLIQLLDTYQTLRHDRYMREVRENKCPPLTK